MAPTPSSSIPVNRSVERWRSLGGGPDGSARSSSGADTMSAGLFQSPSRSGASSVGSNGLTACGDVIESVEAPGLGAFRGTSGGRANASFGGDDGAAGTPENEILAAPFSKLKPEGTA